jgi:hypothetical protein
MLKIAGSAKLTLTLPTTPDVAFIYFNDMQRVATFFKHISLLSSNEAEQTHRLRYFTTELGAYDIEIFADVKVEALPAQGILRILPTEMEPAVTPAASMSSTSGRGLYSSEGLFLPGAEEYTTRIEYTLQMNAELPPPLGLRFMPGRITSKISQSITNKRLYEIADHVLAEATKHFDVWYDEYLVLG